MENSNPQEEKVIPDLELVLSWIKHIEKPCEDGKGNNARSIYLREARKILETRRFKNPHAKKMLEDAVKEYE
jgi:hypothetical protein